MALDHKYFSFSFMILLLVIPMVLVAQDAPAKSGGVRPWLGVYLGDYESEDAKAAYRHGALVQEVIKDSPADKAGIKEEDVILKMEDQMVRDADDVIRDLAKMKPGDEVTFQVLRDGVEKALKARLGDYQEDKTTAARERRSRSEKTLKVKLPEKFIFSLGTSRLGVRIQEMDEDLAGYFNLKAGEGVLITEVEEESPAEKAGFKAGDVITRVNGNKTGTPNELREQIRDVEKGKTAAITYLRKGAANTVNVELDESDTYYLPMGPLDNLPRVYDDAIRSHMDKMREEMERSRDKDHRYYWDDQSRERATESLRESLQDDMRDLKKELDHLKEEMGRLKQELRQEFEKNH